MATQIPLIRVSQTEPFADRIRRSGARSDRLLEDAGIHPDLVQADPEALVPEYAIWDYAERCARMVGSDRFGWEAGLETPVETLGAFGREIAAAGTLRGALRLFLHAVTAHSSDARFSVIPAGDLVWFCRHGIDRIDVGAWQVELYVLGLMIRVARLALDHSWTPSSVLLKERSLRGRRLPLELEHAHVRCGSGVTAIAIPSLALDRRLDTRVGSTHDLEPIDMDFVGSLRLALEPALGTDAAGLEDAARFAGVTPRTLQRWLEREGQTFASVFEQVRRDAALRLLVDPAMRIAEVASRLGYADPANFTRAFRRWTGMTPSRFREAPPS